MAGSDGLRRSFGAGTGLRGVAPERARAFVNELVKQRSMGTRDDMAACERRIEELVAAAPQAPRDELPPPGDTAGS